MKQFKLYFPGNTSWPIMESTYEQLLIKAYKEGFTESYKLIDIDYKKSKYIVGSERPNYLINFIDKNWWAMDTTRD